MSEELNPSVNSEEVAEPQTNVQEQSENNSEVAEPNHVQDENTNAHYADLRRKQELEDYRNRVQSYEQNLDKIAKLSGYNSHDELLQAVAEAEKQQERQRYEQAGIDPDTFNELLEKHPDVQYAKTMKQKEQEQQQLQQEWNELTEMFPDVKPDSIPKEVWELNAQGKSLTDAYLRYNFKNLAQQKEQEALQKLQQNQASSTGSLSGGDVKHNTNIKDMPKSDFEALLRKVKNGEVRQL